MHHDESDTSVEITESGDEYCVWVSPDGQCTIDMGEDRQTDRPGRARSPGPSLTSGIGSAPTHSLWRQP